MSILVLFLLSRQEFEGVANGYFICLSSCASFSQKVVRPHLSPSLTFVLCHLWMTKKPDVNAMKMVIHHNDGLYVDDSYLTIQK